MIPKTQYHLKYDANDKPYFTAVDHGSGRLAPIRTGAKQVYHLERVSIGDVQEGDWFVDDVKLGPVTGLKRCEVRYQNGTTSGFKVWTTLFPAEVWADQEVRVFRPVFMPLGEAGGEPEALADPLSLRFTAEELGAIWEVLNRFVGGVATCEKGAPLTSVLAKLRTTTLDEDRPRTMYNANSARRHPHAVLEFLPVDDDRK